jgi:hypothetical protein
MMNPLGTATVRFSFWQIQIYDRSVVVPACIWTRAHVPQGFARRASTASFATLLDAGAASVAVYQSSFPKEGQYDRVICIPFHAQSGNLGLGAPDDWPHENGFAIEPGHYRLCVAQRLISEDEETIHLFFEKLIQPISQSTVVVRDSNLTPPSVLLEDSPEQN